MKARPTAPPSDGGKSGVRDAVADFLAGRRFSLVLPIVGAVLLLAFPFVSGDAYWIREISLIAALTLVVSGVNLTFGYAGEVQFGQVFMFAVGAYLPMVLAVHGFNEIIVLLVVGGLAAMLVGFVIALPAMRIGGWSLAMASFFLVITLPNLVSILDNFTGGLDGLVGIPQPEVFGSPLSSTGLYLVAIIVTILWLACYRNLVTSRYGVVFRALRESPVLTRSLGYSTVRLKTATYCLGALPAGFAGVIYGYVSLILQPGSFGLNLAIGIVAASVLGGIESVYGCILGAAVLQIVPEKSLTFASYAPIAYGLFLIVAAVLLRRGIGGLGLDLGQLLSRLVRGRSADTSDASAEPVAPATSRVRLFADTAIPGARLAVEGVSKAYGGVQALSGVTLAAEPGSVTALIGSNGSGKTTLLNLICGYSSADEGAVHFQGQDLSRLGAHRIARLGVGRTFQTPIIPRGVSVLDVVASGRYHVQPCGFLPSILRLPSYRGARRADRDAALTLLRAVGLERLAADDAASLPLGTRRMVEVARSLCGNPGLLLLDEPASGLSEDEVGRLGELITDLADAGATVVLIEHNFGFVTSVAQTVHVLHLGELIATGPAATIGDNPRVIESYLGTTDTDTGVDGEPDRAEVVHLSGAIKKRDEQRESPTTLLEVDAIESGYGDLRVLRGVSLAIERGRVEAVLGRNGVGKTTLLATVAGQVPLWQGAVRLGGKDVGSQPSYRRTKAGIALVQEGKRIFRNRTVWENVMIGTYPLDLDRAARKELCRSIIADFPALDSRVKQRAGGLSGGQQQMLAIAQALASQPRLLMLDEPSAGLAPAIVTEVFGQIRRLADEGLTVLVVEQLAQKAVEIADHVTVLDNGRVVAAGLPSDFDNLENLQEAYFG